MVRCASAWTPTAPARISRNWAIDPAPVRRLWAEFKAVQTHRTDLLWQMFTLVAWSRRFRPAAPPMLWRRHRLLDGGWLRVLLRVRIVLTQPRGDGASGNAAAQCTDCGVAAPSRNGIPRFVDVPQDETARRTQASFGYEWTHFNDWQQSGETNFNDYFPGLDLSSSAGASCSTPDAAWAGTRGRSLRSPRSVVAVDFSRAIEQAPAIRRGARQRRLRPGGPARAAARRRLPSISCIARRAAPSRAETERAWAGLVGSCVQAGGCAVYLYWKRHGWKGALLAVATGARQVTTRMPFRCCGSFAAF